MGHGLMVSFFVMVVMLSVVVLWKNRIKFRFFSPAIISCYTLIILVLCKSVGAIIYGVGALLLIRFTKPKIQYQFAIVLAMVTILYPTMSIIDVFPHQQLVHLADSFSAERAQSLEFRFYNEKLLLDRAKKHFFFGWGGWGRDRVYNAYTGRDETVTDGTWIIQLGTYGFVGFVSMFGLLAVAIFRAYSASKLVKSESDQALLAAHALLVGIIMIDQIPNSTLGPWLWLLTGALFGRSEDIIEKHKTENNTPAIKA